MSRAGLVGGDRRFGRDAGTVLAQLDMVGERCADVVRLFGPIRMPTIVSADSAIWPGSW
jgi:hypothetical protein